MHLMKSLEDYGIKDSMGVITYKTPLSHIANIVRIEQNNDINRRIMELTNSMTNQWRLVIETYQRLRFRFVQLNSRSTTECLGHVSDHNMFIAYHELEFKDYAYLFIISLKTYLDLFACVSDVTLNKLDRQDRMPDFFTLAGKKDYLPGALKLEFKNLIGAPANSWLYELKAFRDKIDSSGIPASY